MKAIYINDGSIPLRENSTHWAATKAFGKLGIVRELDEAEGTFEFEPDEKIYEPNLILCNREEIRFINV